MKADEDDVREKLTAYIRPNKTVTKAQKDAFERAVEAQYDYEKEHEDDDIPYGATSYAIGNYSVELGKAHSGAYSAETLSPVALAILCNAGLLRKSLPTARRW